MKNKIITFLFVGYIIFFGILHIIIKDEDISSTERRKLAGIPSFELDSEYIEKLDKYLLDHFPFRDGFRSIKASFNYNILNKLDNNDIYLKDNYIYKSIYPTDMESINNFISKVSKVSQDFSSNNMYIMIIPDKNYYLSDDNFLQIDYDYIYDKVNDLGFYNIDIRDVLVSDDYYETDTHWKQEKLGKVVKRMSSVMNFSYSDIDYKENVYDKFYGVYYGEAAIDREGEDLVYLTCDLFDDVKVKYLENKNLDNIYNLEKLKSLDAYEVYLDGASSFIEITNNNSGNDKELIIFRDSFASSIVPLLVPYYKKIILIDNRYIKSDIYNSLLEVNNQDVLFMYSTLVVNNSNSLKGQNSYLQK